MDSVEHKIQHRQLGIDGRGSKTLTVGRSAQYPTLQAAVNAALLNTQFTAKQTLDAASTITCTQGSKTVTGVGTQFANYYGYQSTNALGNGDRFISVGTGATKKWYPVESIIDDTTLQLAVPFQEATVTTAAGQWWSGHPNITTIEILDTIESATNTSVYINTAGTSQGAQLTTVALRFLWRSGNFGSLHGQQGNGGISIDIKTASGVLIFEDLKADAAHNAQIRDQSLAGTDSVPVYDCYLLSPVRESSADADFIFLSSGNGCGRFYGKDLFVKGNFDIFLTLARGETVLENGHTDSIPVDMVSSNISRPLGMMFGENGSKMRCTNMTFRICLTGINIGENHRTTFALLAGLTGVRNNCTAIFDNCTFIMDGTLGGTLKPYVYAINLGIEDSDIYFLNCRTVVLGSLTPTANWLGFGPDILVNQNQTPNRLHFINTPWFDLPNALSTYTIGTVTTFSGARGRVKALSQPVVANEFDFLRGDTFTMTLTAARAMSPVINAPDGAEVTFILQQDGTGGFNVTWDASYKFVTAWSNAGNTANLVSTATFRKRGSNWYQVSPANAWTA